MVQKDQHDKGLTNQLISDISTDMFIHISSMGRGGLLVYS